MKDTNYPLRKKYKIALNGSLYNSVLVPAYSQNLPDDISPSNYIIYGPVSNNDIGTKSSADTSTLMRVTIHTFQEKYNTGNAADFIAGFVYDAIYAIPQSNLDLSDDNLQMVSTDMVSDITLPLSLLASKAYIDRVIIFRHRIFHG